MIERAAEHLVAVDRDTAIALGIHVSADGAMPQILVTDRSKPVGSVHVWAGFSSAQVFFDNRQSNGQLFASIRMHGENAQCIFNEAGKNFVAISVLNMRSHRQNFFIGDKSTAVELSIEMEGEDRICVIGDDALISSGVWMRNHDMHSIVDLDSKAIINRQPGDILIERHVWISQDVLCVGEQAIGFGAILGARSFVKRPIPPKSIVAGMPATVIRSGVSWGRQSGHVSDEELAVIEYLSTLDAEPAMEG
ncbi:MAG: hypothetical protein IE913_07490 [Halothiobacillus sp.]|nr:hypothetical protein [Halothiobacillus sp.]